jgi:tetratricopeptide (TPR) repeat protein
MNGWGQACVLALRRRAGALLAAGLLALAPWLPAWGGAHFPGAALVAELERVATRYHEDPAQVDRLREGLARAAQAEPRLETLIALARVCFIWGDVRAPDAPAKLQAYDQGREAAKRAIELDPRNAAAHFWYGTNTGRWGQTKGVLRSLFLLPSVREAIQTVLELDPGYVAVYSLAGNVYYEVPGLFGGDLDKAEEMFRKGLQLDPRFTGMRVGLARTLIKRGRIAEARRELEAVLAEREPRNLADWTVKDTPEARRLLESVKGR